MRQVGNPTRKVFIVPDVLALVDLEPVDRLAFARDKIFVLFAADFERTLTMNGLTGRLLQPMRSWIGDPFSHIAKFFEFFVGVKFDCHHSRALDSPLVGRVATRLGSLPPRVGHGRRRLHRWELIYRKEANRESKFSLNSCSRLSSSVHGHQARPRRAIPGRHAGWTSPLRS